MQKTTKDMWKNAVERMRAAKASAQSQNGVSNSHHYSKKKQYDIPAIIMMFFMVCFSSFFGCLAAGSLILWIM